MQRRHQHLSARHEKMASYHIPPMSVTLASGIYLTHMRLAHLEPFTAASPDFSTVGSRLSIVYQSSIYILVYSHICTVDEDPILPSTHSNSPALCRT
jgi:hypothetical protein